MISAFKNSTVLEQKSFRQQKRYKLVGRERADLLTLVAMSYCEFVSFPLVSWVRCGT